MKKILFILFVLMASVAFGQGVRLKGNIAGFGGAHFVGVPPGYTKLNVRYEFVAMLVDSGLHVPQYNGTPSGVRTGVWVGDGAVAVDTTNHRFYIYSGGAWVRVANYSEIPASYTAGDGLLLTGTEFKVLTKRSITIDNDSVMLVNDSTASPVSYFYGTNVAGRKGWYAQSGLRPYTFTNGLTESGGTVKLGGTLVDATTTIATDGNDFIVTGDGTKLINSTSNGDVSIKSTGTNTSEIVAESADARMTSFVTATSSTTSSILVSPDLILVRPYLSDLKIDSLNYTLSTTGKKIMLRDTATGLVQNIDPALITGATPTLQQVLTAGSTLTTANTIDLAGNELEITDNGYDIFMLAPADSNDPTWLESTFTMAGRAQMGTFKTQSGPTSSFTQMTSHYDILDSNIHSQIDLRSNKDSSRILYEADDGYHRFSGNVGIGTVPTSLLHVAGTTKLVDGTEGQGKVLTSDASGNATWKYDTTTLATFTAGALFDTDTSLFSTTTLYGSFYLDGNDTLIVTKIRAVMNGGSSDTLGLKISFNDTINVDGTRLKTADIAINSTTTGNETTSFDNPKIPPGNWVWLKTPVVVAARKPYYLSVSIIGYKKRVN